jgi:hypothetical protein
MVNGGMRTREILFPNTDIKTDSLLYREKSRLLLPEPRTQNLFLVHSDHYNTRFFLSSESQRNLERMESFFSRLYDTIFEDSELPPMEGESSAVILRNSFLNFRRKEFYHPAFVRNIFDYTSIDSSAVMRYCVSIRSGTSRMRIADRFNFTVTIGFNSGDVQKKFSDLLGSELKIMRKQAGFRLRKSGAAKMTDNLLSKPFNLINFVRVPSERDILM